jgi:DNA replication and repair protein RecF
VIVTSLSLADFRNYGRLDLEPHPALTVLVGANAVGKTNVIEALQLVTAGISFRRPKWEELVRWGSTRALVTMSAHEADRSVDVALEAGPDGTHSFALNGQVKRRTRDAIGAVPSVTFTPDDLSLVKGPSERRRSAIDDLGEQMSPTYGSLRRDYGRAVRQRNALLREETAGAQLTVWDEQVARLGAQLVTHRLRLLGRLMERAASHYSRLAGGESLAWKYEDRCGLAGLSGDEATKDRVEECITSELARRQTEERRRAVTLVGPHRDDVVFEIGGRAARSFASQGQQRSAALAWKLAEVDVIEDVMRRRPVLLLDDVMSELDAARRTALSGAVSGRTQTFITTTNLGYFDTAEIADATIVELGAVKTPKKGRRS